MVQYRSPNDLPWVSTKEIVAIDNAVTFMLVLIGHSQLWKNTHTAKSCHLKICRILLNTLCRIATTQIQRPFRGCGHLFKQNQVTWSSNHLNMMFFAQVLCKIRQIKPFQKASGQPVRITQFYYTWNSNTDSKLLFNCGLSWYYSRNWSKGWPISYNLSLALWHAFPMISVINGN